MNIERIDSFTSYHYILTTKITTELGAIHAAIHIISTGQPCNWCTFTNTPATLQSSQYLNFQCAHAQLVRYFSRLHKEASNRTTLLKCILSQCGIPPNTTADSAAWAGRQATSAVHTPQSRRDTRQQTNRIVKSLISSPWPNLKHHYEPFFVSYSSPDVI